MIHRDLCDPAYTKEYSALRMQFHFLLSRYTCLDGRVFLTIQEMANKLSCSLQSIYKFIHKGIKEGILTQQGDRIYLLKRVDDYKKGYVKHFPFLESEEFQNLSLHAQRFVLYCLWYGIHTGRPLKRALSALYHSTRDYQGVLNIYTKKELYPVLEEAKAFLNLELTTIRGIEKVAVNGLREEYAQQPALENSGEHEWLENELVKIDCEDLIPKVARQDLLKMKSEYVKRFAEVGLEMFIHALRKLAASHKLFEMKEEGEIGRYFRSILHELEEKIVPRLKKQLAATKNALQTTQFLRLKGKEASLADHWMSNFQTRLEQLQRAINLIMDKQPIASPNSNFTLPKPGCFPIYNWLEADEE